jgi:tetratricopeptide (TPR) repeat protein
MHGRFRIGLGMIVVTLGAAHGAVGWQDPAPARLQPIEVLPRAPRADEIDTGELAVADVGTASFRNVKPGETSAAEARKLLGEPVREETKDDTTALTYRIEPFARVDVLFSNEVATSIIIHLKRPTPAVEIAKDLELDAFRPAPIPDEAGKLLGIAYPERGVTFGLVPGTEDNSVSQVLLEGVSAEPFVLRAMYDTEHRYEHALADLRYAGRLDAQDPRTPWLTAQVLSAMGRRTEALDAAKLAINLEPTSGVYRLTYAEMLLAAGNHAHALAETSSALGEKGMPVEARAKGERLLGDLLASCRAPDFKEAAVRYQAAIKLAIPLSISENFAARRAAKLVLVEAHLGMAKCIVRGTWKGKTEVAPKWLARAEQYAREFAESERGEQLLRLRTARKSLAVQAALRADLDPTAIANIALAESKRLLEEDRDPYFLRQAAWELGQSIYDAARAEQVRGKPDRALDYLVRAIPPLEQDLAHREGTEEEKYLLGRLYYVGGSVQALAKHKHEEAIVWFDKAAPLLAAAKPAAADEKGAHGERLISMGVSYWETGSREEAVRLTKLGVVWVEEAVTEGTMPREALVIPYGNLANMCQALGHEAQAQEYAALAARNGPQEPKRR